MNKTLQVILILAFVAVLASAVIYLDKTALDPYKPVAKVLGVQVYSKIPIADFMEKKVLGLYDLNDSAERTCNFELSATSTVDRKGYSVQYQNNSQAIYLDRNGAFIMGRTDLEKLTACHAFLCLRDNITCPDNLMDVRDTYLKNKEMIIAIDNKTGSAGIRGYAELLGELGYVQAQLADTNQNGIVEKTEIDNNSYHIYPYIIDGDLCVLQQFKSAIQTLNITNNTVVSSSDYCGFTSGIYIIPSKKNEIQIEGRKILLFGDEDHIFQEVIIVRDIISPEYIRAYYGLK